MAVLRQAWASGSAGAKGRAVPPSALLNMTRALPVIEVQPLLVEQVTVRFGCERDGKYADERECEVAFLRGLTQASWGHNNSQVAARQTAPVPFQPGARHRGARPSELRAQHGSRRALCVASDAAAR